VALRAGITCCRIPVPCRTIVGSGNMVTVLATAQVVQSRRDIDVTAQGAD